MTSNPKGHPHNNQPRLIAWEVTRRYNLNCVHCYLQTCRRQQELSTGQWLGIIDQLEQAATLIERAAARPDASPDVTYYLGLLRDRQERPEEACLTQAWASIR